MEDRKEKNKGNNRNNNVYVPLWRTEKKRIKATTETTTSMHRYGGQKLTVYFYIGVASKVSLDLKFSETGSLPLLSDKASIPLFSETVYLPLFSQIVSLSLFQRLFILLITFHSYL